MSKMSLQVRPLTAPRNWTGLVGGGSTNLDGMVTADLALSPEVFVVFMLSDVIQIYRLKAGTEATSSPDIVRPVDYAPGTNEKVWHKDVLMTADDVDAAIAAAIAATPRNFCGIGSPNGAQAGPEGSLYTDNENYNADPLLSHISIYIKPMGSGSGNTGWQLFQAT